MEQALLWTVIALAAVAGGWRSWNTATPGVPAAGSWLEKAAGVVLVGVPTGAAVGLLAVWVYAVVVGP